MTRTSLTPITRTTLTVDICQKLINQLLRGYWREGDRIPTERELSQSLRVGRASLREALKALEIMGLIETRLGEGTFVCARSQFFSGPLLWSIATNSTEAETQEMLEARKVVERETASLAALRGQPEDIEAIRTCIENMKANRNDFNAFVEADFSFHVAIAKAARNRILLNALELMLNMKRQWIDRRLKGTGMEPFAIKHHEGILQAIVDRDQERASAAMAEHLDLVGLGGIEEAASVPLQALDTEGNDGNSPNGNARPPDSAPLSTP